MACFDERTEKLEEERHKKRRDVHSVGIGIGQNDDLRVAQSIEPQILSDANAERRYQVEQFSIFLQLRLGMRHRIDDLSTQRQYRLNGSITALLRAAACGISL